MAEVFRGSEALRDGMLTEHQLRRWYRPIYRDVYVPKHYQPSLRDRTVGAWLWSRGQAIVAGVAAAALHGAAWIDADTPIELIAENARSQRGLLVRDETLDADEVTRVGCLPVTTVARLDALMRATLFSIDEVKALAQRHKGARGLRTLRAALGLVDGGAMSPK